MTVMKWLSGVGLTVTVALCASACGGSDRPAEQAPQPEPAAEPDLTPASGEAEGQDAPLPAHDMDVEVSFGSDDETAAEEEEGDTSSGGYVPPPTKTYTPSNKRGEGEKLVDDPEADKDKKDK